MRITLSSIVHMQFDGAGGRAAGIDHEALNGIVAAQLHEGGGGLDHRRDRTHIRIRDGDLVGDPAQRQQVMLDRPSTRPAKTE